MSKATITRFFVAAVVAVAVGLVVALGAVLAALAGGAITIGGPDAISVHGLPFARVLIWFVIASLLMAAGGLAAIASWIGALLNTWRLEEKTWFVALLVLGLFSLGWVAMAAYVFAGPDATRQSVPRPGVATTPGV